MRPSIKRVHTNFIDIVMLHFSRSYSWVKNILLVFIARPVARRRFFFSIIDFELLELWTSLSIALKARIKQNDFELLVINYPLKTHLWFSLNYSTGANTINKVMTWETFFTTQQYHTLIPITNFMHNFCFVTPHSFIHS